MKSLSEDLILKIYQECIWLLLGPVWYSQSMSECTTRVPWIDNDVLASGELF